MREIDPQSGDLKSDAPLDARLAGALRGLADSSRKGAPAEVGAGLATAFRRHHARRRLVRRVSQEQPKAFPVKTPEAATVATVVPSASRPVTKNAKPKATKNNIASSRRQFLALPGYDPAVPADELHVVRVQLPGSALWQMGAPVSPDLGARKFMADFVVSQDGTPYAVRLVQ
jgi:hypothetical protein